MDTTEKILERVGEIIGNKKNIAISKALGVSPTVSSNWKSRKKIPWEELYAFSNKHNVNMNWLIDGKGLKYMTDNVVAIDKAVQIYYRVIEEENAWGLFESDKEKEIISFIRKILEDDLAEADKVDSNIADKVKKIISIAK